MKFLKVFAILLLSLISLLAILSCESTDDVLHTYQSKLSVGWQGIGFPEFDPVKTCEDQVCACFTSFKVTVSHFMMQRVDIQGTEPFDLYAGKTYTFDAKVNTNNNFFMTPDVAVTLDPGIYQLQSIQIDKVVASPDLSGNNNQGLNSAPPTQAYMVLKLGAYCSDTLNIQEGASKALQAGFACQDSIYYNKNTKIFYFTPVVHITEPHCVF